MKGISAYNFMEIRKGRKKKDFRARKQKTEKLLSGEIQERISF